MDFASQDVFNPSTPGSTEAPDSVATALVNLYLPNKANSYLCQTP